MARRRLGEFLVSKGVLTREALGAALKAQRATGKKLGEVLVSLGFLEESRLASLLAEFFGLPLFSRDEIKLAPELPSLVPRQLAFRHSIVPVALKNGELFIACTQPVSSTVLENLGRVTGKRIQLVLMKPSELAGALQMVYSEQPGEEAPDAEEAFSPEDPGYAVKLLDHLISTAVARRASDLHLEPDRDHLRVRLRIDGLLKTVERLPLAAAPLLISRLKVLSNMNIAEKRSPQDGGFLYERNGLAISIRVSTLPCTKGEKAVLRLLPPHDEVFAIEELGMEDDTRQAFLEILGAPHGLILVTGPSGSGKTFTLYAALRRLRSETVNITTVEDPVEVQMPGITQTQVDHSAAKKYGYCMALRAVLRQDPDIIMVGEIRDGETATMALQAALTGHLVLSTLHTNDAPSAVERLLDMGCERYLVASALRAVLAQRLVRLVCPECREAYTPTPAELQSLGIDPGSGFTCFQGRGCVVCHGTGYRGRTGIFELLRIDSRLRRLISGGADTGAIRDYARSQLKMRTLLEDGVLKVQKGLTTVAEILRVTREW
ncbi:MAG: Flp pilus assembly complex ATPase component TadA [Firmicutes bacterium]|nr:Flp pilus assembly complex ATPase component TadA [Bacillota bacterium]